MEFFNFISLLLRASVIIFSGNPAIPRISLVNKSISSLAEELLRESYIDSPLITGLGSNGTANRLKAFLSFLMALTHHALPHPAWQRNIVQAY